MEYLKNYDRICADDLGKSIMDKGYLQYLSLRLAELVTDFAGAEICEIGSGQGFLAQSLLERGAKGLTTIDIAAEYLYKILKIPGIRPVLANAENLPFHESFDIVITSDVLEHVLSVGSFLYSVNRALKVGGRLYLRTPYLENLMKYSTHFGCPYRFVHLRTFNRKLLRQSLEDAGFVVDRLVFNGFFLNMPRPFWQSSKLRTAIFRWFEGQMHSRYPNSVDINSLSSGFLGIFLKPIEITAVGRKVRSIEPLKGGCHKFL